MSKFSEIDLTKVPKHVAVIMDGNGRWAKQHGKERLYGHGFGVESVRETLKAALKSGVEFLTLYAFSTENWNRPKEEVDGLMSLLVQSIANEIQEIDEMGVRMHTIGDISGLPENCGEELEKACSKTSKNTKINLVLALNYSARSEIQQAFKKAINLVEKGELIAENIDNDVISKLLMTNNIPDPELLIRTSGEHRVSNFMLWQIAYTEFYFTEVLWPDFTSEDFFKAIIDFQSRERRFGKVSEQLIS